LTIFKNLWHNPFEHSARAAKTTSCHSPCQDARVAHPSTDHTMSSRAHSRGVSLSPSLSSASVPLSTPPYTTQTYPCPFTKKLSDSKSP
jgi:hypothetical protein